MSSLKWFKTSAKQLFNFTLPIWIVAGLAISSLSLYSVVDSYPKISEKLDALEDRIERIEQLPPESSSAAGIKKDANDQKLVDAKLLEKADSYNKDLLITVFFSLLGTVATIGIAMFGINYIGEQLSEAQKKRALKIELQHFLNSKISRLGVVQQVDSLNRRLLWLEYKISVVSSEFWETQGYINHPTALAERIRALQILQNIQDDSPSSSLKEQIESEIEIFHNVLESFSKDISDNAQLTEECNIQQRSAQIRKHSFDQLMTDVRLLNKVLKYQDLQIIQKIMSRLY